MGKKSNLFNTLFNFLEPGGTSSQDEPQDQNLGFGFQIEPTNYSAPQQSTIGQRSELNQELQTDQRQYNPISLPDFDATRSLYEPVDNAAFVTSEHPFDLRPHVVINDEIGALGSQQFAAQFPAIVALSSGFGSYCTGTLIAPDVVLSARHCGISANDEVVFGNDDSDPTNRFGIRAVSDPGGPGTFLDGGDVTIVFLDEPVPESVATPMRLLAETEAVIGEVATFAGFGVNGLGSTGHGFTSDGLKWGGRNVIDNFGPIAGGGTDNLFGADFDDGSEFNNTYGNGSAEPLQFEAITAPGDSGGPLLVERDGEYVIVGVLSGGSAGVGRYGSISLWTGISLFEEEIADAGGIFGSNLPSLDDHFDTLVSATELQFNQFNTIVLGRDTGTIGFGESSVDTDGFSFILGSTSKVILDSRALSVGLDTQISLYDSNGLLVGINDDAENPSITNSSDSQLIVRNLQPGEYFALVEDTNGNVGNYRFSARVTGTVVEKDEFGNSFATADLGNFVDSESVYVNSEVAHGLDEDFFQFTAVATGELVVRSKALSGDLNTVLRSYDADQRLLDSNNNFRGELDSRLAFNVRSGESYFLRLSSVRETVGDYRLSLRIRDAAPATGPLNFVAHNILKFEDGTANDSRFSDTSSNELQKLVTPESPALFGIASS